MKKRIICLLLGLVLFAAMLLLIANRTILSVPINDSTFPDKYFQVYIKDKIDRNSDNALSGYERITTKSILLSNRYYIPTYAHHHEFSGAVSLQGIENFPNLKTLICSYSSLETLDLSKNPHLHTLDCGGNALDALDLSKNPHLQYLNCGGNALRELDVSINTKLDQILCNSNNLVTLDVSNNSKLILLECPDNSLTALDLSNNPELSHLRCYGNKLTSLDLSNNENLYELNCSDNSLTELNTTNCTGMEMLICDNNELSALDVSSNTGLHSLICSNNNLSYLDVSKNARATVLECSNNHLKALDVTHQKRLTRLYCADNALAELDLTYNEELEGLHCENNSIQSLDISNTQLIRSEFNNFLVDNGTEIVTDTPTHTMYLNDVAYAQVVHGNKAPELVAFFDWYFLYVGFETYKPSEGDTIEGWYIDESLSSRYTLDTPIESDIHLYMKVKENIPQKLWHWFGSFILFLLIGAAGCGIIALVIVHGMKKESEETESTVYDINQ